jgi:hypothetical protein
MIYLMVEGRIATQQNVEESNKLEEKCNSENLI